MSWDTSLTFEPCAACGRATSEVEVGNYTYNVGPMYFDALGFSFSDMKNKVARDVLPDLERACREMFEHPQKYKAMNPENGWGDYEGALAYLMRLRDKCRENPGGVISIW